MKPLTKWVIPALLLLSCGDPCVCKNENGAANFSVSIKWDVVPRAGDMFSNDTTGVYFFVDVTNGDRVGRFVGHYDGRMSPDTAWAKEKNGEAVDRNVAASLNRCLKRDRWRRLLASPEEDVRVEDPR
mgnify:FL=1